MLEYLALIVFVFTFIFIVFEIFDKSLIALSGALFMIIFKVLSPEEAIAAIDYDTIFLLLGMMILVNLASKSGVFEWLNVKIAAFTKGNPLAIFILFSLLTAVLSAFLDNVTTVILIVPLTIELVKGMGKDPKPYILMEIFASNIGGSLTLIGDPPNIIIAGATGLTFVDFIVNLWIPIVASMIFTMAVFIFKYWKSIKPISNNLVELFVANIIIKKIKNKFVKKTIYKGFVIKVVSVLLLTLVGFLLQHKLELPNYVIAFGAAILLAVMTHKKTDIHHAFASVEWDTLFFFAGLFIIVAGVEKTGILESLSNLIVHSTTDITWLALIILWVSGIISIVLNNIPFITVMLPVIIGIQSQIPGDTSILWWALSLGACLGGNGTIIGASANVISVDVARKEGIHISFIEYMKFSLPMTIGILIICSAYIFIRTI